MTRVSNKIITILYIGCRKNEMGVNNNLLAVIGFARLLADINITETKYGICKCESVWCLKEKQDSHVQRQTSTV